MLYETSVRPNIMSISELDKKKIWVEVQVWKCDYWKKGWIYVRGDKMDGMYYCNLWWY